MEKIYIENQYIKLWYEDEILHGEYQPDLSINLLVAEEIIDLLKKVCDGRKNYSLILDVNNLEWIDKEARDFLAKEECTQILKAWAFFSKNPLHKLMHVMYVSFSKPKTKTKFFVNKNDALEWLKGINGREKEDKNQ